MLISFIVPTFNRASLVTRAIDSVLEQRAALRDEFEIVVVDDGSTDETQAVLARYRNDPAVVLLSHAPNRGLGAARSIAFRRARGQWCALLDSDNALLPGVGDMLRSLLDSQPADIGVVWAASQDADGQSLLEHDREGRVSGRVVLRGGFGGEHFSVVRTVLAQQNPYPTLGTRHACEPAFWARLALSTDFLIARVPLQFYETSGDDRFCGLDSRLGRAGELARCYEHTAALVRDAAPPYYWELRGKAAFYRCVAGEWSSGAREAVRLLPGVRHQWRNLPILISCLAGPSVSRWLLRRTSAA